MRPPIHLIPLLALLLPAAAGAQSAHWEPSNGTLAVGQVTSLQLEFDNCEPKATPVPPKVDGLTVEYSGQSSNISWINGDYSRSVTFTFAALLAKKQAIDIPAFSVDTNKGALQVPAAHFDAGEATVGGGQSLESAANSALEASPSAVWAGQVFNLAYRIDADRTYSPDFGHGTFSWSADPLLAEDWGNPEPYTLAAAGGTRTGLAYHSRAIVRAPGSYRINPITQLINLSVGVTGFGFFQQRQYQQFSVTSSAPAIEVRPLPPPPAGFAGAVGDFKLASRVVPTSTVVGEPVTWTVELSGTGNWPDVSGLPARAVSKDFQVVQPKAKRKPAAGKLFDATLAEDVVLMPTVAGTYPLEPVRFTYFDPRSGTYKVLSTPRTIVTVSAAGAPAANESGPSAAPALAGLPPVPPEPPSGLPRDPLAGPATAGSPWSALPLGSAAAAPFAVLILFWLGIASKRARRTDPQRGRCEARARVAATLAELKVSAGSSPQIPAALLLAWQRDSAVLWEIAHAAPMAGAVADAAWSTLWSEADRALYGAEGRLPPDWIARAEAALGAKTVPRFSLGQLFLRRNLLPWLSVVVLALACAAPSSADEGNPGAPASARDSAGAYRRGDFAAAEAGWRADIARNPVDWTARYNLSVALAQQNRWDEAAAQAAAAFAQEPADSSVRWQFALACEKAGYVPDALAGFLAPETLHWLARLASPAVWQCWAIAAAGLAAIALGLFLARGYGLERRGWTAAAWSVLAVALGLAVVSGAGWRAYGFAADSGAAIVWRNGALRSIPTEVDAPQKTTPLSAGSVGIADKTFLGWVRLDFGNGQTGWVRREDIVGIWQ
jgi:hypothetical protein